MKAMHYFMARWNEALSSTLTFVFSRCDADIVFCENSSADLSRFTKLAEEYNSETKVHCLSFAGNTAAERKGKGYGESQCCDLPLMPYRN